MILSLGRGRSCPCQTCMAARLARSARGRKERFSDPRVRLRAALVGRAALGPPRAASRGAGRVLFTRRKEKKRSRFGGVFIIAVHRAFVLGLGARYRGLLWSCQRV